MQPKTSNIASHRALPLLRKRLMLAVMLLAVLGFCAPTFAADKRQAAKEMQKILDKAKSNHTKPDGLKYSKQLLEKATQHRDTTYIAAAYFYEGYCYQMCFKDFDKAIVAFELCESFSEACDNEAMKFDAEQRIIACFISKKQSIKAHQYVNSLEKDARKKKYGRGIYQCLFLRADIFNKRNMYETAIEGFQHAIEFGCDSAKSIDIGSAAFAVINLYLLKDDYSTAFKYIDIGLSHTWGAYKQRIMTQRAIACFATNDSIGFIKTYNELKDEKGGVTSTDSYLQMLAFKHANDRDYKTAHAEAEKIKGRRQSNFAHKLVFKHEGKWEDALYCEMRSQQIMDSLSDRTQDADIVEQQSATGAEQLKRDNMRLQMLATQYQIDQENERQRREEAEYLNNLLKQENNMNEKRKLVIEDSLRKVMMETRQRAIEKQEMIKRTHAPMLMCVIGSLVALLIGALFYWRHNFYFNRTMAEKNRQLEEATRKAEVADAMKTTFMQNMSHEIRTPLNAIVGFSDVLLSPDMDLEDEDKASFTGLVELNNDLLSSIVDDFVTLAEIDSGQLVLKKERASCNEMCRKAMDVAKVRLKEGVKIYLTTTIDDSMTVVTDPTRVVQIMKNFLTNAEKYTSEGEIEVQVNDTEEPGYITMAVRDTGIGIPEDKRPTIFDRFEKVDAYQQGVGVGLSICALLGKMLDAKVDLDPNYTTGCRFFLKLKI